MQKICAALCTALLLCPVAAEAWGDKGHLMINRLAIRTAAADLPAFMGAAARQITYNGYEPDRWREESGTAMNTAQAPDHFFDSELWGPISSIAPDRYAFMARLPERKVDPIKIGYLPYAILENYGRLRNAFRQWRKAATAEDRELAQANAIFYAGVLGHYAGDSTMPMHLTIHYNGWAEGSPNPKNFTQDRMFHSRYENAYVNVAIDDALVGRRIQRPKRLNDVFGTLKTHLAQTFAEVEAAYQLEKEGEFKPEAPRPRGTDFIAVELARAATLLGDLWYTAWLESGEPVPQPQKP